MSDIILRKLLVVITLLCVIAFIGGGCKKSSSEVQEAPEPAKTVAEYKAEAEEQINKDNMAQELSEIEEAIQQETSQEK